MANPLYNQLDDLQLVKFVAGIWGQQVVADVLECDRVTVNRWLKKGMEHNLRSLERQALIAQLLPTGRLKTQFADKEKFRFADLFAGIGGIRQGFEQIGGRCVFTSEWDNQACRTYKANHFDDSDHVFNTDIRSITAPDNVLQEDIIPHIDEAVPDHDVLLAGFPCQPFSIAGVSKKNSLGDAHGFDCKIQGTLFHDICKVLQAKRPAAFMLENVKNLKSHNKGDTYETILKTLDDAGYDVPEPQVVDAKHYLPQHRERIVIVGFRRDLGVANGFSLLDLEKPKNAPMLADILNESPDPKYVLSDKLWEYLKGYAEKHKAAGNGFGFGLVYPDQEVPTRTLSARYYKDGSEIVVYRGKRKNPRRLTPRECSRLMGFDSPQGRDFHIPVSDTQSYKQFGNSVAVPVFEAVARLMEPKLKKALKRQKDGVAYNTQPVRPPEQINLMEKRGDKRRQWKE